MQQFCICKLKNYIPLIFKYNKYEVYINIILISVDFSEQLIFFNS